MLAAGVTAAITAAPAATIITAPHRDTPNCIIRVSLVSYFFVCECGGMVDALSSGGSECMLVGVQLPPLARCRKDSNHWDSSGLSLFVIPRTVKRRQRFHNSPSSERTKQEKMKPSCSG